MRPGASRGVWYVSEISHIPVDERMGNGWKKLQARCRVSNGEQQFYCRGFGDDDHCYALSEGEKWAFVLTDEGRGRGDLKMYTLPKEPLYLGRSRACGLCFTRDSRIACSEQQRDIHHSTFFEHHDTFSNIYAAGTIRKTKRGNYKYCDYSGHYGRSQTLDTFKHRMARFFTDEARKGNVLPRLFRYDRDGF